MQPIWTPSDKWLEETNLSQYQSFLEKKFGQTFADYTDLHAWSVSNKADFWQSIWDFAGIIGDMGEGSLLVNEDDFLEAQFFPDARLNFAENVLAGLKHFEDNESVIVFWSEQGIKMRVTKADLLIKIKKFRSWFQGQNLQPGDRVCAFVPNTHDSFAAVLAASSLGLVWASCSPDFGVEAVLDRFEQLKPKALVSATGYYYKGRYFDLGEKVQQLSIALGTQESTVVFDYPGFEGKSQQMYSNVSDQKACLDDIAFERFPFNHPLYVMFSSGTTGKPKCIVHGAGGTLIQHVKEHQLHCDIKPKDRVFYFSTCSWMMWNWHVTTMASGAAILLFDGFPFLPTPTILFDFAEAEKMTLFGTASKYIDALRKRSLDIKKTHDLSALRMITSTGGPLVHESFEYIYKHIKQDVCVASISGGTDIISCFVLGCPTLPVYAGQIQCKGLGMDVSVVDEEGISIQETKGELTCQTPFPSKPIEFVGDPGQAKYKKSYFDRFDNVWCHGDYAEITAQNGLVIYGRSDNVLNPGGVRIGTAEIYRQVEKVDAVTEALAVGQQWDEDVRIILFVTLRDGVNLEEGLKAEIRAVIKQNSSPRHVPSKIIAVPALPKTKNGKLVENVVRNIIHEEEVINKSTLENPECLAYFANLPELQVA